MQVRASFGFLMAVAITVAAVPAAFASSLGQFDKQADVGSPAIAGGAAYDSATHSYALSAGGANMFHDHDEFHFVWRKLKGDFAVGARVKFVGTGVEAHRKAGLMARSSLDAGAAYVDGVVHGQGPTALQTRRTNGADTEMMVTATPPGAAPILLGHATPDADYVQLERRGDTYMVTIEHWSQPATQQALAGVELGREVYVGLFLCAHNAGVKEQAVISDVRIERHATR